MIATLVEGLHGIGVRVLIVAPGSALADQKSAITCRDCSTQVWALNHIDPGPQCVRCGLTGNLNARDLCAACALEEHDESHDKPKKTVEASDV